MQTIDFKTETGRSLKAMFWGHGNTPCLFIGPASIYFPTLPEKLGERLQFVGVDDYWTIDAQVPQSEITKLTIDQMVEDVESYRFALNLGKVLVCGPSAVGLVAKAYALRYPETTLGVITIGTPLTMKKLLEENTAFFQANYDPHLYEGRLATPESIAKWQYFQERSTDYAQRQTAGGFTSPTEDYIAELERDEPKYYREGWHAVAMYKRWETFNIATRNQFFSEILKYDTEALSRLTAPTLSLLGLYDGIVPPYLIPDNLHLAPRNFQYHIFSNSAHMPQLEDPKDLTDIVFSWLDTTRPASAEVKPADERVKPHLSC